MDVLFIYVKKYRLRIVIILLAVFFGEICATATSYITKSIVDTIANITSGSAPISSAYWLVIITPIISLVANFCYRVSGFTATTFFPSVRRDVRVDFFSYLHSHTHRYFSNHFGGALTNKITTVGRSCEDMLGLITWDLLPSVINILFSLILLFLSSLIVGGVTLGIIILYMAVFYPFLGRARKLFMVTADARSASTGKIADVITNIWNLQSHARGEYEENRLVESFNDEGMKHQRGWRYMECIRVGQGVMSALFVGIIGYLTIWLWSEGKISVGSVVLVFMIAFSILSTVRNLAQRFLDFNEKKSDIADAISTIIIPYEIEINQKSNTKSPIQSGKVELQNITFAYDDRGNVFENLSLTIPHGQKVGFVGVSGSGKSTLVLLLQRFYDIQSGKIVIDGHDISAISQDELRSAIAVVPQDPVLFHRSLFENIAYGSPDATREQVIEASKLAHADEFITHLPE